MLRLDDAWDMPLTCARKEKQTWKEEIYQAVHFNSERENDMLTKSSLTRYNPIKQWQKTTRYRCFSTGEQGKPGMLCVEKYLDEHTEHVGRKLKTLCRLNALPLMDKIGKQEQWNPKQGTTRWKCPMCGVATDNLTHFLLECTTTHRLRVKLISKICNTLRICQEPHQHRLVRPKNTHQAEPEYRSCPNTDEATITPEIFLQQSHEEILLILLGKQIGCPKAERHIDVFVKRFLRKAWKLRRPHVVTTNRKYSRNDYLILS